MIIREKYLQKLREQRDQKLIKVVTGIRRSGKSTLLEAFKNEELILWKLRGELKKEFEKDLWDKAMERQRGKGTLEDLYMWYKKQVKQGTTTSEFDIKYRRANTKGLDHLIY